MKEGGPMGLLFYDGINGVGAFYSVDSHGNMTLLHEYDDWRKTWSQIVPTGFFYPPEILTPVAVKHLSLLFYDAHAGEGFLYNHDDAGNMSLVKSYSGWRHTWKQIIPGNWGETRGLLFYDAQAGEGAFYSIDAQGNMALIKTNSGWPQNLVLIVPGSWNRKGWSQIVSIRDVSKPLEGPQGEPILYRSGLLFYHAGDRVGEFYVLDDQGHPNLIKQEQGWRNSWTNILETDVLIAGKTPVGPRR
jgi:hypothetical protein